jgi:glycolate oxidase
VTTGAATVRRVEGFLGALGRAVGPDGMRAGADVQDDDRHDEAIGVEPVAPLAVVTPTSAEQVAAVLRLCGEHGVPVTARGSGSGLSGAATPVEGGIVVSFERMRRILDIDVEGHVAVVEPGVQLDQLDEALAPHGLAYPVYPGEYSATIGGNIATNAGGMRAVRYGVTRQHVLGLQVALPTGEVLRTGGRTVKASSGYDLTQLVIGSEGTLALVTEATLKLAVRPPHAATVLAPFPTLGEVTAAVPALLAGGLAPSILEYVDLMTMAAIHDQLGLELGVPEDVRASALAYLVVRMESTHEDRVEQDVQAVAELLVARGATDAYVLPAAAAQQLIEAREKAFWLAKANHADDIVDVCVPRGAIPELMERVRVLGEANGAWIAGCGHAGDGNVHLAVFQQDAAARSQLLLELFRSAVELGGVISGEHGIGIAKKPYFTALEDPAKLDLLRRIKRAFDPAGILNPGKVFDLEEQPT